MLSYGAKTMLAPENRTPEGLKYFRVHGNPTQLKDALPPSTGMECGINNNLPSNKKQLNK